MILSNTTKEGTKYGIARSWAGVILQMYWIPCFLMGVKLLSQHKFRLKLQIGHKGAQYITVVYRSQTKASMIVQPHLI